jgi:uncharacterized protein YllA (UPF0747 family)
MGTLSDLYENYIKDGSNQQNIDYFYGKVPRTIGEVIQLAKDSPKIKVDSDKIEKLKKILLRYHSDLGLLTPKVESNIELIDQGIVLGGQQATIFGGSGIIGNKIATVATISDISKEKNHYLVPMFLVNTHDSIQPEISTIHLPNYQTSASKPILLPDAIEGIVSSKIQSKQYGWLNDSLSIIKNIFNEFRTSMQKDSQKLFSEKVDHILTFIQETYRTSKDIGEWITLLWGIQANIINDWGVVFFPSSNPDIRKLTTEGYIPFLKKRKDYIEEFNNASSKITELGYQTTTAKKTEDFSPFFYECPKDGYRLNLSCQEDDNILVFKGNCPLDKQEYSFEIDKRDINLSNYLLNLVPRLDTNQALLQSIMPVYVRVSGPGEINYNAQVQPAIRKLGIQFPIFVKYTRILYNTPWIENLSQEIENESLSLFAGEFFKTLGSLAKARRKREEELLFLESNKLAEIIKSKMSELSMLSDKPNSIIERYKSWQFGMYDEFHKWQEVSWPWFIMASITGLKDYLASYKRYYSENSPIGGIGYINARL